MTPTDLLVRPATADDLAEVAEVYLAARAEAAMPPGIHPPDDVRRWVTAWDLTERDVWLAVADDLVVGFANATATWLDGLYVLPPAQGSGVGSTLLDLVKSTHPDGIGLWVFEMNVPARAFYAHHGFAEVERTDGADNEERAPDIRMEWRG